MKRISQIIIMMLAVLSTATFAFGETIVQKGKVLRYNGKNAKTSLGDVYIKVPTAANGAVSDSDGSFSLALNNLKPGDRIGKVQVTKKGMMIFNQDAVDE